MILGRKLDMILTVLQQYHCIHVCVVKPRLITTCTLQNDVERCIIERIIIVTPPSMSHVFVKFLTGHICTTLSPIE